ncbi:hypothetical protein I4U23_022911 [Adineta vaga]|nr:hypothetical protein I4U23_022911 [Adineta vaga]
MNLFLIYVGCFTILLPMITTDLSSSSIAYCKIQFFIRTTLYTMVPYYLVLASIDRALITSPKESVRKRSSHRLAYYSILGVTLFFLLFYFHHLIIVNVYELYPTLLICYYPPGVYRVFISIYDLIIHGTLPSFLLIIFGVIALRNVHGGRVRPVQASPNTNNIHRPKDRQLFLFLLFEIIGYVPSALLATAFNIYRQSTQYHFKSAALQGIELFITLLKFTRETPNDFYLSGDQVEGIVELTTNETNDLYMKYGLLHVELIGELHDFKRHRYQRSTDGVKIFFRRQTKLIQIKNQQKKSNSLRIYRWTFHGLLDCFLPSSLPPKDDYDPCICYYAYVYFDSNTYLTQKSSFLVFTRSPMPNFLRENFTVQSCIKYKSVKLHGILSNKGLIVPEKKFTLQIKLINPLQQIIKSIRIILKQYRFIIHEETDLTIFSFLLPGFESDKFHDQYRQCTYEFTIPLDKCRLMAPTSHLTHVRYELQIECYLNSSSKSHLILKLPIICTTDHQSTLNIPEEFQSIPEIIQYRLQNQEDKQPPSYEDFLASEILPTYNEIIL